MKLLAIILTGIAGVFAIVKLYFIFEQARKGDGNEHRPEKFSYLFISVFCIISLLYLSQELWVEMVFALAVTVYTSAGLIITILKFRF